MNQLKYCVTRLPAESLAPDAVQRAYKKGGYVGVFTPGNSDELLKMILSMTTDAQIYKSFKTTVYGFELYKGTVYVSGTTTNTKLEDIYKWKRYYGDNSSYNWSHGAWQWTNKGDINIKWY
jgi:phosphotransferase system IIB component